MKALPYLSLVFLLLACGPKNEIKQITASQQRLLAKFKDLKGSSNLELAQDQPGKVLHFCGTLMEAEDSLIIPRSALIVYHADSSGEYNERFAGQESTADISGKVESSDLGRFYIKTILPGDYPNRNNNRHIHFLVPGAQPEGYDVHFAQHTDFLGREFIRGSDQHFLGDIRTNREGEYVVFVKIAVQDFKRKRKF